MADAAVGFLLSNLKELLLHHVDLIPNVRKEVESLHKELSLMRAFLKDSREKHNEFEYVRELVGQITDVTYEAEDIIDTFVVNAVMQKARSALSKVIHVFGDASNLHSVAKKIVTIRGKVKDVYDQKMYGIVSLPLGEPSRRRLREKRPPTVEENNVVGFDEEAQTIIDRLTKGPKNLEVVSVVGMGGLAKLHWREKLLLILQLSITSIFVRGLMYLKNTVEGKSSSQY